MSIRVGDNIIAGGGMPINKSALYLFDFKWSDHLVNQQEWLRADTFTWHDGTVYQNAYQHLLDDYNEADEFSWSPNVRNSVLQQDSWLQGAYAYGNGKFVVIGRTGTHYTSTDGTTWTNGGNTPGDHGYWQSIAFGQNKFVALSYQGYISTSTDGDTWSTATQVSNLGEHYWNSIIYDGTQFMAMGLYGYVSTSTNGTTWTAATQIMPSGYTKWQSLCYGNGLYIAFDYDGYFSTSTDGVTWSTPQLFDRPFTPVSTTSSISVVWDGTQFVLLCQEGYLSYSSDGTNWSIATPNENLGGHTWNNIVKGADRLLTIGVGGYVSVGILHIINETIAGTTISFHLASDGHKIVTPNQEAAVGQIFLDTGVAWYYILDEANTRFKLPRTEHGVVGVRGNVGDYVEAGLPDIYGNVGINDGQPDNVLFKLNGYQGTWPYGSSASNRPKIQFKASDYNSIYGNSTTVQPPATQMYLYFYVGEFTQTATQNTAGINSELFNSKADISTFQVVTALPANPNPDVFYFVIAQ